MHFFLIEFPFASSLAYASTDGKEQGEREEEEEMGKEKAMNLAAVMALWLSLGIAGVAADASDHRYKPGEAVPLYANKVGPFHNPR